MQKKLIALAVAGLVSGGAFAQSNVTISGKVQAGYDNYQLKDTGAANYSAENRISDQSSRIIFAGSEDLGGGLKAVFQLDSRFAVDATSNLTNGAAANSNAGWSGGNTYVGLVSASMGTFGMGHVDVHYGENGGLEANRAGSLQANATAGILSQNNGNVVAAGSRGQNVFWWDSVNMSGFTARVGGSTGHATEGSGLNDGSNGSAKTVALRYGNGPLVAGMSYWTFDAEGGAAGDQRSTRAWAGFTMGDIKFGLVIDQNKNQATAVAMPKRTAWMLPVTYTMGPSAVYFTYAKAGDLSGVANSGAKQFTLGYDYGLSKRTSVGVFYTDLKNEAAGTYDMFGLGASGATATGLGMDARQLYMGMTHTF